MKKYKKIVIIIVLIVLMLLLTLIGIDNFRVKNTEYSYSNRKIPQSFDGYKICVVSDFHNSNNYNKVIKAVENAKPDIICIAGDLISMRTKNFSNSKKLIEGLEEIAPIYFINGNQEYYNASYRGVLKPVITDVLKDYKIEFMNDRGITIEKDGDIINLIGSDDSPYEDNTDAFLKDVKPFLSKMDKKMDKNIFSVLLIHRPHYFSTYSKYDYDLILSGHLHGGVIRIPGIESLILKLKSGTDLYSKGVYENNDSTMIVSGGLGTTHFIPRIFNTPEIVTVTLMSK